MDVILGRDATRIAWSSQEQQAEPQEQARPAVRRAPAAAPASSRLDDAVHAAAKGRHADALKMLRGEKGRRAEKLRAWIRIHQVTASHGCEAGRPPARRGALVQRARGRAHRPSSGAHGGATSDRPEDAPLVALLGGALPRRRDPLVDRVMGFADENADRVDEVAAAA